VCEIMQSCFRICFEMRLSGEWISNNQCSSHNILDRSCNKYCDLIGQEKVYTVFPIDICKHLIDTNLVRIS
jgi:hypothetical protein